MEESGNKSESKNKRGCRPLRDNNGAIVGFVCGGELNPNDEKVLAKFYEELKAKAEGKKK